MAGPITWRNVNGDGGRQAAQLLNGGQNQINNAADGLLRTLDQFRKLNVSNAGIIRADNTQNFLDQVAGYDAAQLATPEVQAQLEQARLAPGNAIDRDVARGAVDQRLGQLQKAAIATQQYNDVQEEVAQRPVLEDLAAKLYSGDKAGYEKVLEDTHLRDEAGLRNQLMAYTDAETNRGYRAAGENRAQGAEQRSIASFNLGQEVGRENLANTRSERKYRDDLRETNLASEAIKMVSDQSAAELSATQQGNIFATGSADVNKDATTILKNAGLGDGEFDSFGGTNAGDRQAMQKATTSLLADGVKLKRDGKEVNVPIPPALIEQYFATTKGEVFKGGADAMKTYFTNMFKDNPELAVRALDGKEAKDKHNKLLSELKKTDRELRLSKNPKLSSTLGSIQTLRDKLGGFTAPTVALLPEDEEDRN